MNECIVEITHEVNKYMKRKGDRMINEKVITSIYRYMKTYEK